MVYKEEIRLWKIWQFFDKYGFFPFEKKRIDITISGEAVAKIQDKPNKSEFINQLIISS